MVKKILLIGPLSPPITGNSLSNDIVIEGLKNNKKTSIDYINTQFETFNNGIGKFSFRKAWFFLRQFFKLYKVLNKHIIYITPGQTFFGVIKYAPFIYFAKFLNKQVILHIHGNYLKKQYNLLSKNKKCVFKKILEKADKGIVLSKSLVNNLTPFLSTEKIFIVPNFVQENLRCLDFEIEGNEEVLKVIFLSNLMEEKGVLDLLNALVILKNRKIKFEARFAGNLEEKIKPFVNSFLDNEEITYLGPIKGEQKKELLEWGNVFVLPTYYKMEGVPISILEAMSKGNIIVTTRHGGIEDIISERNGFFVLKKSPTDITDRLIYIESNLKKLSATRKNNIKDSRMYSEKKFINNLLNIFIY